MPQTSIVFPCLAMVGITAVVWLRLYFERIGEMRSKRIRPQTIATSRQAGDILKNTKASDNFRNLFEVPVLFYVLCLLALDLQAVTPLLLGGAWVFVALRALHSFIHCTYNRVMHRFPVYVLSTLILFALWGLFGINLQSR
ncbi:MAG: MAPEG family protein [Sulfuricaulis sp.]